VQGTRDGQIIRESLKLRDWNRAQELVREWDVEGRKPKLSRRITIEEWKLNFTKDAEARFLNSETLRKYTFLFKQLSAFAEAKGICFVNDFDLMLLTEFRTSWKDGPLTSTRKLQRLRNIFKFATARKWIDENIALHLKAPKVKDNPTLPFTADEFKRILNSVNLAKDVKIRKKAATIKDIQVNAFILTMRFSGLRISDVTMLAVDTLQGNRLRLYTAKTGAAVSILLPDYVANALRSVPHSNPNYFFWSGKSKMHAAISLWRKRLSEVFKKAKIVDAHSHRFRDTFSVSLLENGMSLDNLATLLGNSVKIVEKHYSPWVKTRQDFLDSEVEAANLKYSLSTIS